MDNITRITEEYEGLKGQFVICGDKVYRLIGIADDDEDYYYALYDGRQITLHSCVGRIMPLKGYMREQDYNEMIRIAKLNHLDQPTLYNRNQEEGIKYSEQHKKDVTHWKDTRFILGPHWELI